jgi:hypothetical protein
VEKFGLAVGALLLKVVQSVEARSPGCDPDAVCTLTLVPEPMTALDPPEIETPEVPEVREPMVRVDCFPLNVLQSAEERKPFAELVACGIAIVPLLSVSGD